MTEQSLLAGLLDRAGNVFSIAGALGRAFHEEHQERGDFDAASSNRHSRKLEELWAAILELREPMQNPPNGFGGVAEHLKQAARISKRIRGVQKNQSDGPNWTRHLDCFADLNSISLDGLQAVKKIIEALRVDDPIAFVDQSMTDTQSEIDTTPASPKPPSGLIEPAARAIPLVMSDIHPNHDGVIELIASHLVKRLQDAGHTLAASQWALHEAVRAGRMRAGRIEVDFPISGRMERCTIAIPEDKAAPFDCFIVRATDTLWTWWKTLPTANSGPGGSEAMGDLTKGPSAAADFLAEQGGGGEGGKTNKLADDKTHSSADSESFDPTAYVQATRIIVDYKDQIPDLNHKRLCTILDENSDIKRHKPSKQRLLVHFADFDSYVKRQQASSDQFDQLDEYAASMESRKASIRKQKERQGENRARRK